MSRTRGAGTAGERWEARVKRRRRLAAIGCLIAALCLAGLLATAATAVAPEITLTTFSGVTSDSAVLEAEVNPKGKKTEYHFEYGAADCSSPSSSCTSTAIGSISPGTSAVRVKAPVKGLTPASTSHFRILANNADGPASGLDTFFTTHALRPPFGPCANDAFRSQPPQPSGDLPDCRAYEQASPVAKDGVDARARVSFAKASLDGDRISFSPPGGMPGAQGGQNLPIYLSSRGAGNWSTQGLLPPAGIGETAEVLGWSSDFSEVFDSAGKFNRVGGATLVARSSSDGSLATIVPYGSGLKDPVYVATSADNSKVLFESSSKLPSVPASLEGKSNLYLWDRDTGTLSLAGVLNGEPPTAPPGGAFGGSYDWIGSLGPDNTASGGAAANYLTTDQHVISADGKSIYFTAGKTGQLYLRRNPTAPQSPLDGQGKCTDPTLACTLQVSASQRTSPDPAGTRPAAFLGATPDGSRAFFTSSQKLTDDANTGPELAPASIARAKVLDGLERKLDLVLSEAKGIATDATYIYWANPVEGTIGRAKLDGSEVKTAFIANAGKPQYVTVDAEHIYWTNAEHIGKEEGTIGRAKLDPSEAKEVEGDFITDATNPQGIDAEGEYLYWGNAGEEDATRTIGRTKLGASEAEEVIQGFIEVGGGDANNTPLGVAVNGSQIYFTASGNQQLSRIIIYDVDGNPASRKVFFTEVQNEDARGIALDSTYVYWARQGKDSIARAKLDFSEPELEWMKEAGRPLGLAVNASNIFWSANQESPPNPGNDLYRYDAASGELSDLAVGSGPAGADVLGILGTSEDGAAVYFAANGNLDGAGPAAAGDCENFPNFSGQCSLYLAREGSGVSFVAPLDAGGPGVSDALNWVSKALGEATQKTARVSADGQTLLFRSQNKLSAYDNKGAPELYRYQVGEGITCVSCNPSGEAPSGTPSFGSINLSFLSASATSDVLSRNLSADGKKVFFETTDALVGEDTNGLGGCPEVGPDQGRYRVCLDAYEWEAQGSGSCQTQGGCIYLLSTGKSPDASYLADASASGKDAFIITRSQLVRQDEDQLYDVYDARVGGGLIAQNEVKSICKAETSCKGPAGPAPEFQSPATASFAGPPDPKPKHARKGKKAHHHKGKRHKHKHKGKGRHGRAAKTSGRAGK